jgi:hypothetical protein
MYTYIKILIAPGILVAHRWQYDPQSGLGILCECLVIQLGFHYET